MKLHIITITCLCFGLLGCQQTRSISDSGYKQRTSSWSRGNRILPAPPRELNEMDVLGIDVQNTIREQDIQEALTSHKTIQLKKGGAILLVQSGAAYPDAGMVKHLEESFNVISFSGIAAAVPNETETTAGKGTPYSRLLRLAAARGGCESIVCYWGIMESAKENLSTKTVSWLPVVNWMVPDERQHMRIRLKIALIDVRSGAWTMLTPEAFQEKRIATNTRREGTDQRLVESLKKKAYEAGAKEVVQFASNK
jgi:hypothetical protein